PRPSGSSTGHTAPAHATPQRLQPRLHLTDSHHTQQLHPGHNPRPSPPAPRSSSATPTQRVSCPPHRPPGSPTIFVSSAAGRRSGRPLQWLGLADGTRLTSQGSNPAGTHPRDTGPAPSPATPAHPPGRRPSSHRLTGPSTGSG